eukprot:TRINITY_DN21287_c0_g1_i1.p1 TRINITY_DN21287_c0_g1~~TRINITY_DN21287_c0_g1_i1.p1  ORF type:complete len:546 (-),score=77.50 TRINITY_DN21287_c0_g1_i1:29-1666(-)
MALCAGPASTPGGLPLPLDSPPRRRGRQPRSLSPMPTRTSPMKGGAGAGAESEELQRLREALETEIAARAKQERALQRCTGELLEVQDAQSALQDRLAQAELTLASWHRRNSCGERSLSRDDNASVPEATTPQTEQRLANLESEISALQNQVAASSKDASERDSAILTVKAAVEGLSTAEALAGQQQRQIEELASAVQAVHVALAAPATPPDLVEKLTQADERYSALSKQCEVLESAIDVLSKQMEALRAAAIPSSPTAAAAAAVAGAAVASTSIPSGVATRAVAGGSACSAGKVGAVCPVSSSLATGATSCAVPSIAASLSVAVGNHPCNTASMPALRLRQSSETIFTPRAPPPPLVAGNWPPPAPQLSSTPRLSLPASRGPSPQPRASAARSPAPTARGGAPPPAIASIVPGQTRGPSQAQTTAPAVQQLLWGSTPPGAGAAPRSPATVCSPQGATWVGTPSKGGPLRQSGKVSPLPSPRGRAATSLGPSVAGRSPTPSAKTAAVGTFSGGHAPRFAATGPSVNGGPGSRACAASPPPRRVGL